MPEIALPPFLTHCLGIVLILHTCLIAVVAYAAVANLSKGDQKCFIRRVPFSCDAYVRGFSAFFLSALPPPVLSRSVAGLCRCGHVVSEPQRAAPLPPSSPAAWQVCVGAGTWYPNPSAQPYLPQSSPAAWQVCVGAGTWYPNPSAQPPSPRPLPLPLPQRGRGRGPGGR